MTQVLEILSLQEIDTELGSLRAKAADVEHRLEGDEELAAAGTTLADADEALAALQKTQRRLEAEITDLGARIKREDDRLYGGTVTSVKELRSLQHELDTFRTNHSQLQEQLFEVLSSHETATEGQATAAREVTSLKARWEAQSAALREEAVRLQSAQTRAEANRIAQTPKLEPANLRLYESLRTRRGSPVVVRVTGAMCTGCRVSIPDGLRRQLLSSGRLSQCPNCERILTVG